MRLWARVSPSLLAPLWPGRLPYRCCSPFPWALFCGELSALWRCPSALRSPRGGEHPVLPAQPCLHPKAPSCQHSPTAWAGQRGFHGWRGFPSTPGLSHVEGLWLCRHTQAYVGRGTTQSPFWARFKMHRYSKYSKWRRKYPKYSKNPKMEHKVLVTVLFVSAWQKKTPMRGEWRKSL